MSKDFPEISTLKAGDLAAWDEAFPLLWPMALRAAQHPEACLVAWEAEDVASDAILEVISQINKVGGVDDLKALVITIAYRRAISLARRKSASKRQRPEEVAGDANGEASISLITPATDTEQREMMDLLGQALGALDNETRLLLREKMEQDLTYHEISTRHGLPIGTVCTKVARGLKRIRTVLKNSPWLMKELKELLR